MTQSNQNCENLNDQIDYTTAAPRFSVLDEKSLSQGLDYLNEHGYVVISDIMNENEINQNKDLLWKFIQRDSNGAIQRNNPDTWSNNWPQFSTHGVIKGHGIGQSELLWNVRSNRSIKKVFAQLWNTRQLLTSFDGCCTFRDWRYNSSWKTGSGWNHVDQNPRMKPDKCCIQGLVSLYDQNEKTGGLIVYPQTHLQFDQLKGVTKTSSDFVKVLDTYSIMNNGKTRGKLVHCKAGDLILWDSRTVHCNSPAVAIDELKQDEPVDLLRLVVYVSMGPVQFVRNITLEEFRQKRKDFVERNITTNHWSTELDIAGEEETRLPPQVIDNFTEYQKALIFGYEDNESE